ncbi:sel1 repeat family protein [Pelomyxa schiedti]|nr:sel1 repeat family protein [Pelomyxa schiedti]
MLARGDLAACDAWCAQIVGLGVNTDGAGLGGAARVGGCGGGSIGHYCDKRKCAAHFLTRCVFTHAPSVLSKRRPFSWDSKEVLVSAVIATVRLGGGGRIGGEKLSTPGDEALYLGTGYYLMGLLFEKGIGVQQDHAKGAEAFRISASLGHSMGQNNLAFCFDKGAGVEMNQDEAIRLLELSAAKGNPLAQVSLANRLRKGIGMPVDRERGLHLLRLSAEQGNPSAQANLGYWMPLSSKAEAFQLFYRAAVQGHNMGQNNLGVAYMQGLNGPPDSHEAVKWLRLSASQGNSLALRNLGDYYRSGKGTNDIKEAFRLYLLASSKGDHAASAYISEITNHS